MSLVCVSSHNLQSRPDLVVNFCAKYTSSQKYLCGAATCRALLLEMNFPWRLAAAAVPVDSLRPIQALLKSVTQLGEHAGQESSFEDRYRPQSVQQYTAQSEGGYVLGITTGEGGTWEGILVQNMYKDKDVYDEEELVSHHLTNDAGKQAS